jgi:hypothetical protein
MFILAVPLFVGLLWMVFAVRGAWENARATVIFIVGLTVFLGSAGGLEILYNFTSGVFAALQITAEEVGEMLGVTIMLWAAYELMVSHEIAIFAYQGDPRSTKLSVQPHVIKERKRYQSIAFEQRQQVTSTDPRTVPDDCTDATFAAASAGAKGPR